LNERKMTGSEQPGKHAGLIFDLKRYAINDGPGIRLAVFLKGCNLHCAWCHNPEGISPLPEKMFTAAKCIGCGTCVAVCPEEAITLGSNGIVTDDERCTVCGKCAEVCPTLAIGMAGRYMTVPEVMAEIEKERPFFDQSGGGVTFSGGEPLLQHEVLIELLKQCGERGVHRAVDTAGHVSWAILADVAAHTDLFLYDLKIMDAEKHRTWTGVTNELILSNLRMLSGSGKQVVIRIPLVAGVNDDEMNIRQTAAFIASLPGVTPEVHLLPYHAIAQHKYAKLGRPDDFSLMEEPGALVMDQVAGWFSEYKIVSRGG
jgi:pyruvate formate lyase activating enzyme